MSCERRAALPRSQPAVGAGSSLSRLFPRDVIVDDLVQDRERDGAAEQYRVVELADVEFRAERSRRPICPAGC